MCHAHTHKHGRVSWERETGMAFLTDEKPLWPKPFRDLSLGRMLALKQVLVTGLKGKKECRNQQCYQVREVTTTKVVHQL